MAHAPEPETAVEMEMQAAPAALASNSLDDLDSELEAVFEPEQKAVSTMTPIDPTRPEAFGSFAPTDGPPKDDDDAPEDLLVELIEED
jgi:hypothetical protein